jgi:septum formation protein
VSSPLILASTSPRRRELLARAGFRFEVFNTAVAERADSLFSLRELTTANATRKALAAVRPKTGAIVLAADTLLSLEGEIIGKPANMKEARTTLRKLSGRVHEVCTAVFMVEPCVRFVSFTEISHVEFRQLTENAIEHYFAQINPLDKAGAYAAQGVGKIIRSIEGSVSNVVGLPMKRTTEALLSFGISPAAPVDDRRAVPLPTAARAFPQPPPPARA